MSKGGKLVAVSVDPAEKSKDVVDNNQLPFAILADVDRQVIEQFGVVHKNGGPNGEAIAIPSHFLIGKDLKVHWINVSDSILGRPDPARLIELVQQQK